MIPRKFLQEWVEEQRRAFLAVVGLDESPAAAQTAEVENPMSKLEDFISLMECFPSAFAQPNNGFTPADILVMAAEIRQRANMPSPPKRPAPGMGALPPP